MNQLVPGLLEKLWALVNAAADDDVFDEDAAYLNEKLKAIQALCKNYDRKGIMDILDNLLSVKFSSATRKALIRTALSLVGRVPYFWGGKSAAGWNEDWNKPRLVSASALRAVKKSARWAPRALLQAATCITKCFTKAGRKTPPNI